MHACFIKKQAEPVRISIRQNHGTPIEFVVAKNIKRRHLSASQRAVVALDALPFLEEAAKKRQLSKLKQRAGSSDVANLPTRRDKETSCSRSEAAQIVGASSRYVSDAKRIQKTESRS